MTYRLTIQGREIAKKNSNNNDNHNNNNNCLDNDSHYINKKIIPIINEKIIEKIKEFTIH